MKFFVNLQSLCQGAGDLCAAIQDFYPDFVGLVETHLDSTSIGTSLPPQYTVAAHKDRTHHGGGVLILCKDYLLVDVIDCANFYIAGSCELIAVCFNVLLCIYLQLSDSVMLPLLTC